LAIAVVSAPPQLGVERVRDVGIYCAHLLLTDTGDDVFVGLAAIVDAGFDAELGVSEMTIDQLSARRVSTGMTSLVDLVDEAREDPLRLGLRVRTTRHGLAQVHAIFGDRVGAGVEGDPERARRQRLD